ncbi:MAG: hypothetical protein WD648_00605 [Planctomycetaceae bacterium]
MRISRLSFRSNRQVAFWFAGIACVALLVSCKRGEYEISLKPTPEGLERTVKFGSTKTEGAADSNTHAANESDKQVVDKSDSPEIARLAAIYDSQPPKQVGGRTVFAAKVFSGQMPQDVGGSGHYVRFESPFGAAVAYIERFRGNDDLHAQFEARPKAVDQFVDLGIGWFESEFGKEPGWPALKEFVDTTLRRDVQNVSMFSWSVLFLCGNTKTKDESAMAEIVLRACQYFVERGYVTYEELPALEREIEDAERGNSAALVARFHTLFAAKIGKTQPSIPPETLSSFLLDEQRATESWRKYFEQTEFFQQRKAKLLADQEKELAAIRESKKGPKDVAAAEAAMLDRQKKLPDGLIMELWLTAFAPWFDLRGFDRVKISLATNSLPVYTNGKWNAEEKRVVWSEAVKVPDEELSFPLNWPNFVFAIWDDPDANAQLRLFGSTAIQGKDLVDYCLWYHSLTADEKQQWETFVATLKPDSESRAKLKNFRFAGEPQKPKSGQPIANEGIKVLSKALKPLEN